MVKFGGPHAMPVQPVGSASSEIVHTEEQFHAER